MPSDAPESLSQNNDTLPQPDPTPLNEEEASTQQLKQQHQQVEQQTAIDSTNVVNTEQPQHNNEQLLNDVALEPDLDLLVAEEQAEEFVYVDLLALRREVQCPICLGIIKKTRTVMECLHRFCRECIDKSMRMGNNECPACRTHCASRRSLRDDPRYDELIAALYPDIKKFEEEELAFYEEDETRNKQIQETITQVAMKQTEALGKKRPGIKDIAGPSLAESQRNNRSTPSRRRKRRRRNGSAEYQDSEDNKDVNVSDRHHSPYEQYQETYQRKRKSRASIGSSQSPSATNFSGGSPEDNVEQKKEERGLSPGLTCSAEMLVWGKGGVRNTRHGHVSDGMKRSIRLAKLVEFLRDLENDEEYMALQAPLKDKNDQMLAMQEPNGSCDDQSTLVPSSCSNDKPSQVAGPLHILDGGEKLSGVATSGVTNGEQLILAYQRKEALQAN